MKYLACSGNWSQDGNGFISCDTAANVITEVELAASLLSNSQMTAADMGVYFGYAALMLVLGYGIKITRQVIEDRAGRRG